jgi:voltage-gated potassium channel
MTITTHRKNLIAKISGERIALLASFILLGLLLIHLFILPVFPIKWHELLYNGVATIIYLNLVLLIDNNRKEIFAISIVLICLEWLFYWVEFDILNNLSFAINIVLFVVVIIKFLIQIAKAGRADVFAILQCINGYLLIGMLSSVIIGYVVVTIPGAFIFPDVGALSATVSRLSEFQYMGLVTLSTLGYGDITPVLPFARSMTTFIAVVGQLYVAIIIALLVGKFSGRSD